MKVQAATSTEIRPEKADQKHRVVSGSHTTQQTQKHLQVPHEIHQQQLNMTSKETMNAHPSAKAAHTTHRTHHGFGEVRTDMRITGSTLQSQAGASVDKLPSLLNLNATHFDYNRMEKLFQVLDRIKKSTSFMQILRSCLESINEIINCSQGIFVIFQRDLLGDHTNKTNSDQMGMVVQKNIVEGKYTDLVSITDKQV